MTAYEGLFPVGLGTNRFAIGEGAGEAEIERMVALVLRALELGITYVDTLPYYSHSYAPEILRRAFAQTDREVRVPVKIFPRVGTAEAVKEAVKRQKEMLGLTRISEVLVCCILNYAEFEQVMKPDGVYDGARQLLREGAIDRITFSTHASTDDIVRILEADVFEGVTLAVSAMNYSIMKPVLDCALKRKVDVAVMNPLGGGFLAQNQELFSFLKNVTEKSVIRAALRFAKAHPAVKLVLAGPATREELEEDIEALTETDEEPGEKRLARVGQSLRSFYGFCTGCRYCEPCPNGVHISSIMQSRNMLLLTPKAESGHPKAELLRNLRMFRCMDTRIGYLPDSPENPCVRCGACEKKCTQKLKIMDCVEDTYRRIRDGRYSMQARRERLDALLNGKGYKKVGIWPGRTGNANRVLAAYREFFGEPEFEVVDFKTAPAWYDRQTEENKVYSIDDVLTVKPDCILVVSYNYGDEIMRSLEQYRDYGIDVVRLYEENDVPWIF